jgi:CheY-like chemotaxis protein
VDDDELIRQLLAVALRQCGFSVRLAADGREAVDVYRQHQGSISLALLDVLMPKLDGPQALTAMKEVNPLVRSCFMTGHSGEYSRADLLALGAAHVFSKPFFNLPEIAELLRQVATATAPYRPA